MKVQIKTEYIKLDQLLKYMGVAENGSHAKEIIIDEEVKVNGEVCTMRGKKLYPGDKFTYEGQTYLITIHATL